MLALDRDHEPLISVVSTSLNKLLLPQGCGKMYGNVSRRDNQRFIASGTGRVVTTGLGLHNFFGGAPADFRRLSYRQKIPPVGEHSLANLAATGSSAGRSA